MILIDLVCSREHQFEAWFRDNATYDAQSAAKKVPCPVCGDAKVHKALTAPALVGSQRAKDEVAAQERKVLVALRQHIEKNFDYVGDKFPEEARRIHYGETTENRPIYGEAKVEELQTLAEEGIEVAAIPWAERQDS